MDGAKHPPAADGSHVTAVPRPPLATVRESRTVILSLLSWGIPPRGGFEDDRGLGWAFFSGWPESRSF